MSLDGVTGTLEARMFLLVVVEWLGLYAALM
jgi:hypothetical protein